MSFIGLFTKSRPQIGELYFDAVIQESDELTTDVTEFPIENGTVGHDHAVIRPLRLTMRVGVSDNPFRVARRKAADTGLAAVGGNIAGTAIGAGFGQLGGETAAGVGIAADFASGQAASASQTVLENIRDLQRRAEIIEVVGAKASYDRMMITGTRRETNKENEQALELVVDLQEMLTVSSPFDFDPIPASGESATQGQPEQDQGLKVPQ